MLFALAWRNLWRQKTRTILTLVSMAFTAGLLVFSLSFQLGSYDMMRNNTLSMSEGFAQVQPEGYSDDPDVATYFTGAVDLAARLSAIDGIAAAPRAVSFAILADDETSFGAAILGVDPAREPQVTRFHTLIDRGRYLAPGDSDAIVIGDVLARNLGLGLGDRVTLLGSGADRSVAADSLEIVGLIHSAVPQLNRQIAQMPLGRFQETFAMEGGANVIALGGADFRVVTDALDLVRAEVAGSGLVVRDWAELSPALKQAIQLDMGSAVAIYGALVFVAVFIILNSLLMSVLERTREFGVLLAIGMKPRQLGGMMWIELILLAALGSALGIVLGGAVTWYFMQVGIFFPDLEDIMAEFGLEGRMYPTLSLLSVLVGPLAITLSVAVGGLVPFRRILRLEPVSAMGAA